MQWGDTALVMAIKKGHTATVQALIGAGANLNLQEKVVSTLNLYLMVVVVCFCKRRR
jgi:ankyrin repeat protein